MRFFEKFCCLISAKRKSAAKFFKKSQKFDKNLQDRQIQNCTPRGHISRVAVITCRLSSHFQAKLLATMTCRSRSHFKAKLLAALTCRSRSHFQSKFIATMTCRSRSHFKAKFTAAIKISLQKSLKLKNFPSLFYPGSKKRLTTAKAFA